MKQNLRLNKIGVPLFLSAVLIFLFLVPCYAQETKALIKRTAYKSETVEFGIGGTVSIIGAPNGSISVEGWQKNAVEISAEVEMQAASEADLAELAKVNGFVIDNDFGHIRITSVGTHDKSYMKRVAKKFPKLLLAMPLKIDYVIKVPVYSDLNIDGGKGDLNLSNVEGMIRINYLESNAKLNLIGGTVFAAIGKGEVDIVVPNRSWRGRSVDVQLVGGTMRVQLPLNLNANLDAQVLRTGQIENALNNLKPRERTRFSEKSIAAKAGSGGAPMSFTVGDGTLKISETAK
ncbi:MAG TPA: hypothetical protein VK308_16730 [Pyrinomonadaceae bacterium]|nr:hypothetical protein [Pyrinomonadaceae bacterium]